MHPDTYYSIWYFRSALSHTSFIETDSLPAFYDTVFPDSLKECFDGREALKTLKARINAQKGMQAPDYTAKTKGQLWRG